MNREERITAGIIGFIFLASVLFFGFVLMAKPQTTATSTATVNSPTQLTETKKEKEPVTVEEYVSTLSIEAQAVYAATVDEDVTPEWTRQIHGGIEKSFVEKKFEKIHYLDDLRKDCEIQQIRDQIGMMRSAAAKDAVQSALIALNDNRFVKSHYRLSCLNLFLETLEMAKANNVRVEMIEAGVLKPRQILINLTGRIARAHGITQGEIFLIRQIVRDFNISRAELRISQRRFLAMGLNLREGVKFSRSDFNLSPS